jgi:hypothetical protein
MARKYCIIKEKGVSDMAESYCLKSCADCGREGCGGCKSGAFAGQCEIAKCCKEKNHESCGSCTREGLCSTRKVREQMPEKFFDMQRREAELAEKFRVNAAILAKWVKVIFWLTIAALPMGLLELIGSLGKLIPLVTLAFNCAACYCYYRMKPVDESFGMIAGLQLAGVLMATIQSFLPEGRFLYVVLTLVSAVCGLVLIWLKCDAFRDALIGISREMSEKWANQWLLYKIGLYTLLGCVVLAIIPVLNVLAVIALLADLVLLLFVLIREYVYLYQTAKVCEYTKI